MNPLFTETFKRADEILAAGGVMLYPTDTVWGIGCNPMNESSYNRIFSIKHRDREKSCILLAPSFEFLESIGIHTPAGLRQYSMEKPTTIIYEHRTHILPGYLCAEDGSVAIRVPHNGWVLEFLTNYPQLIVSTSANISGRPTPTHALELDAEIVEAVDYCVSFDCEIDATRQSSRIIRWDSERNEFEIIRG